MRTRGQSQTQIAQPARLDPLDVTALEQSVNDSALRVSKLWIAYLVLAAYLAVSVASITHRQLLLTEPVKLPLINLELSLAGFAVIGPAVLILAHAYLLFQVIVLARTANVYNEALARGGFGESAQARVRYRLRNTLFAQLFAGSPREREGPLGFVLRLIALITLSVLPLVLLLAIQATFLPIHHPTITWMQRFLVLVDTGIIGALWPSVLNPHRDVALTDPLGRKYLIGATLLTMGISIFVLSFPSEPHAKFSRYSFSGHWPAEGCRTANLFQSILPVSFDRLSVRGQALVSQDRIAAIEAETKARDLFPSQSRRSHLLGGRELRCIDLEGSDLRYADFSRAEMEDANFRNAVMDGAEFEKANLAYAYMVGASLIGASFEGAHITRAWFAGAKLQEANFTEAELKRANFFNAKLQRVIFHNADLRGATMGSTRLAGATFFRANLQGADLDAADLRATMFNAANLQGASLVGADLRGSVFGNEFARGEPAAVQVASLNGAVLTGADLTRAQLQGASLGGAELRLATISETFLWRADINSCAGAYVRGPDFSASIRSVREGERVSVPITAELVTELVAEIGENYSEEMRAEWKNQLRDRLSPPIGDPSKVVEELWKRCAADAIAEEEYHAQLAEYLTSLPCEEDQPDGRFVLEGLFGNRFNWLDWIPPRHFARAFVEGVFKRAQGGCPALGEIPPFTRERLLMFRRFFKESQN